MKYVCLWVWMWVKCTLYASYTISFNIHAWEKKNKNVFAKLSKFSLSHTLTLTLPLRLSARWSFPLENFFPILNIESSELYLLSLTVNLFSSKPCKIPLDNVFNFRGVFGYSFHYFSFLDLRFTAVSCTSKKPFHPSFLNLHPYLMENVKTTD